MPKDTQTDWLVVTDGSANQYKALTASEVDTKALVWALVAIAVATLTEVGLIYACT